MRLSLLIATATSALLVGATQGAAQGPEYEVPKPPDGQVAPSYLSPFPVVRLVGNTTRTGVRITLLGVRSPKGSSVTVRCRGGRRLGCPFRSKTRKSPASRVLRFRKIERRLRAGVLLELQVRKGTTIGKYTSFKIRRKKVPLRNDACLFPDTSKPQECP